MISFDKIKLVIWDLDDTFWHGTLSEGDVSLPQAHADLIVSLTDIGIVNSICSKNDFGPVKAKMQELGLWSYFVFPSVSWESKGMRVRQLIEDMQLRPVNVLFLDDNHLNREEVKYFCPEIMTEGPEEIEALIRHAESAEKKDLQHKRLNQYKVLEEKHQEKANYGSNEEFLMESAVRVEIEKDCMPQLGRIHELLLRSNQLNFTKDRCTQEALQALIDDPAANCGYVSVRDRFGDYGIVGFYAVRDGRLVHFAFSCRTLGMGIEQYVFNLLGRPELEIVGEVISDLSDTALPKWINRENAAADAAKMEIRDLQAHTVLVKGPCDLFQVYPYIANTELFDTEFTHTTDSGLVIESTGHTTHIVQAGKLTQEQKNRLLSEVPFAAADMFSDRIYRNPYKVVFISILTDANLGVYRRKETGEEFAFLEYVRPLTDPANWPGFIEGRYNCGGFRFTQSVLRDFAEKYEFAGRNTPEKVVDNLRYIRAKLPKDCILAVMLGGELYYEKEKNPAYMDRHIVHKAMNDAIRAFAAGEDNVRLLDVNRYLVDQSSFYDHFNHYIKPVYYQLAGEMVEIVNAATGSSIRETPKIKMALIRIKEILAPTYRRIRRMLRR